MNMDKKICVPASMVSILYNMLKKLTVNEKYWLDAGDCLLYAPF